MNRIKRWKKILTNIVATALSKLAVIWLMSLIQAAIYYAHNILPITVLNLGL